jgi:hypothetical protein
MTCDFGQTHLVDSKGNYMRLRGEFVRSDGLVIPNNVTIAGARMLLAAALRNTVPTFWVGLCSAVYEPDLAIEDVVEPTIATNGYARLAVARDSTGWPGDGEVNGEVYFESLPLVWQATGGPFDQPVTRMFISATEAGLTGDIFALSAPLPDDLVIDIDTLEVDRTFKYRLFAR